MVSFWMSQAKTIRNAFSQQFKGGCLGIGITAATNMSLLRHATKEGKVGSFAGLHASLSEEDLSKINGTIYVTEKANTLNSDVE